MGHGNCVPIAAVPPPSRKGPASVQNGSHAVPKKLMRILSPFRFRPPVPRQILCLLNLSRGHFPRKFISHFLRITRQPLRPRDLSGSRFRQVEPHVGAHNIFRYALTERTHPTESELGNRETLIRRPAKPFHSLSMVLRHNLTELVQCTENVPRHGAAWVGVSMNTRQMLGRVGRPIM
jgi:hypothetical protein